MSHTFVTLYLAACVSSDGSDIDIGVAGKTGPPAASKVAASLRTMWLANRPLQVRDLNPTPAWTDPINRLRGALICLPSKQCQKFDLWEIQSTVVPTTR